MAKIFKNKNLLYVLISLVIFLTINLINIYYYLGDDYVSGWDGLGHVAVSYAYHNHIFPKIFGNIPVWFNGMPFSYFYPPLFYFTTSFIAFVDNQSIFLYLFKIFNISMLLITVIIFYFLSLELLKSKNKALTSNIFFILIISTYKKIGDLGISVESVFTSGFLPQSFSFIFFGLFLLFFNKNNSIKNRIFSIITLLCVALSNIHILIVTVLYILVYFTYLFINKNYIELKSKILDCFFAASISLFWFLPMFYYYKFSGAKSSNYGGNEFIDIYLIISIILSIIVGYISHKEKNKHFNILAIYVFFISLVNYLPITNLIVSIPLHVKRWLIIPILLIPILTLYITDRNKILKAFAVFIFSYIFLMYTISIDHQHNGGYFTTSDQDGFKTMIEWIVENKDNSNLINVESAYNDGTSYFWQIHALLGMNNVNTTYAILRESSVMTFAFATIRNSIAKIQETNATKVNIIDQAINQNYFINQGIDIGITHFLVNSDIAKKALSESEYVTLEKGFKNWDLYKANKSVEKYSDNNLKVILTYTDFDLKKNTDNQFDLTRLSEELIFNDMMDLIFYQSTEKDLSRNVLYLDSSGIFIVKYKYTDLDKAYNNILKMSHDRPVFLLKDENDKLFKKLYSNLKNSKNIYFIDNKEYSINTSKYHKNYKYIFKFIDARASDHKSNAFKYIRKSYFPDINESNKRYVATPFYILESKTEQNDNKLNIVKIASFISILSIILTINYFIHIYRKENYNVFSKNPKR